MGRTKWTLLVFTVVGCLAAQAGAQGPGRGGPGGPGGFPGGGRPMSLLMQALDTDGNGEISAEEIAKAVTALMALDKNKDGKLTDEELRPNFGPGGGPAAGFGGGPGGPGGGPVGRGGPGGFGGPDGPPGGPGASVEEIVARYLSLDANKDGKLTKDELPERMQGLLTRADTDGDGVITKDELTKMAERQAAAGGRGGPGGPGGPGGGRGGPGGGFGGRGGPGGFGPPNPQEFVDSAMQFDADKDGKLSKEELAKMAEQFGGGPRGFGGRGGEGNPPPRPQRP